MQQNWFLPLTILTFILGAFIALALKTENKVRATLPSARYSGLAEAYLENKSTISDLQATIDNLRMQNDRLEDSALSRRSDTSAVEDELRETRMFAGLTPVEGPGIVVVLNDSKERPPTDIPEALRADLTNNYLIHDVDIQRVVNELRAVGAEAFAVNGQRVVATTAIRCVGPAIQVNGVPLTPPYKIAAIGSPDSMSTALNMADGVADMLKQTDPAMITINDKARIVLPEYAGAVEFRYSKPLEEAKDGKAGR